MDAPRARGRAARWLPLAVLAIAAAAAIAVLILGLTRQSPRSPNDLVADATSGEHFSLGRFEIAHLLDGLFGEVGALIRGQADRGADADRILERYFALGDEIRALERAPDADASPLADLRAQRRALENRAERILERRIAAAFRAAGFSRPLPWFGGQEILWPPVAVELSRPPRVLAVSPRDEIRLLTTPLLSPDLGDEQVHRIEASIEADGRFSAFVDRIGGIATYPAIVLDSGSYTAAVTIAAHEWVHHYLYFYPLGASFFASDDLRTINETVADIVGDEIAALVFAASPRLDAPAERPDRSESDAVLNQLRRDVDGLLADGRIAEAEALMEEVRRELAARHGRFFRRLNQAFFAFKGIYGDRPESSSPIGPLLRELRARSDSLGDFVASVREVESVAELQALRP